MPSRRATLRAGAAGVATALSGCMGSLIGGAGGGSDPEITLGAFAADQALTDVFDVERDELEYANATVDYWNVDALAEYPDARSLLNGDRFPFLLRIEDDAQADWNDRFSTVVTTVHRVRTATGASGVSGLAASGPFDAAQYRQAAGLDAGSDARSVGPFDLYLRGPSPAVGVADGAVIMNTRASDLPDGAAQEPEDATSLQVRHLEELADRLTNRSDPAPWKRDALDRVSDAHYLSVDLGDSTVGDGSQVLSAEGASPSGDGRYRYRLAIAGSTAETFRDWWDAEALRESLSRTGSSEPTIETGDRVGHAEVTVGAEALIELLY